VVTLHYQYVDFYESGVVYWIKQKGYLFKHLNKSISLIEYADTVTVTSQKVAETFMLCYK